MPAKLALFAPIVAGIIQLTNVPFIRCALPLDEAISLYWALMAIAAGQAIYFMRCPPSIKEYGANRQRFMIEKRITTPISTLSEARRHQIIELYEYSGGRLKLGKLQNSTTPQSDILSKVGQYGSHAVQELGSAADAERTYKAFARLVRGDKIVFDDEIDFRQLEVLFRYYREAFTNQISDSGILREIVALSTILERSTTTQKGRRGEWKVAALEWTYTRDNNARPVSRLAVAVFYILGFKYFVERALSTIWSMLLTTYPSLMPAN